jgi:PAS domain S-box-containing protein
MIKGSFIYFKRLTKTKPEAEKVIPQILQGSLIPTFVIDNNHIITHWNSACERLSGFTAGEMIGTGKQWCAYYHEEKPVMADLIVDKVSEEVFVNNFGNGVIKYSNMDGAYEAEGFFPDQGENGRWLFITTAPLKDDQGKIIGAVEMIQDITARKQTEKTLQKAQEELERQVEIHTAELTSTNANLKKEIAWRKRVEEEIGQSENHFRTVADFTYDWEYWIDPEGGFVYITPSCERITGYGTNEFIENSDLLASITHPDDRMRLLRHIEKEMMADGVFQMDFRITTKKGEQRWISHYCQPVFDANGSHLGRRASNRDITKRKQLEATLRKEHEKLEMRVKERTEQLSRAYDNLQEEMAARKTVYETLHKNREELRTRNKFIEIILDNLPIGLAVNTISDGVVHYMNSKFAHIYGWPKDVLNSFDAFFDHVYPDPLYRKMIKNRVIDDIATHDPSKMIWENLLPSTQKGEQRNVTAVNIPLFEQNLMISTVQDVTEKHKANEALQFTRFSIDHANDMIYWVNPDGKIVDVNETTCIKLEYSRDELLSMTVTDINPSLTLDKFYEDWKNIKHKGNRRVETSHYCKSGEAFPVEIHISHIEFSGKEYNCIFARDITARKELERLVAIQDKMGSLGRVAAGIAHEIRNPLSTINVYLSTLKRILESENFDTTNLTNIKEATAEMDTASHKIETIVKRVMDFSKPSQQMMQLMNVNQCVRDAIDLSMVTLRKSRVALELKLDETLPECYMNSQLIEQVVLNLITNAIEELTESEGARQLEVGTAENGHDDGQRFIVVTVADSGSGVPAELGDKIFDPFFTTKHYGSGIGLSICHRIINDHHGSLRVSKSKWGGALFVVELPVKKEAVH